MIKVVAKHLIQAEKTDKFMDLVKQLVETTRKEVGCITYELYQDEKDASIMTMIEEWESRDALNRHMESEHFKRLVPIISEMIMKETEMNIYNKVI